MLKGYETIGKLALKYKKSKPALMYYLKSGKIRNRLYPVEGSKAQRVIHINDLKKYLKNKLKGIK